MAVPKKKMSKSKRNLRRYVWTKRINNFILLAVSFFKKKDI
ncbi:MAG: 50S ribosomal protein L32 [Gammaproteobacteria bacterium]